MTFCGDAVVFCSWVLLSRRSLKPVNSTHADELWHDTTFVPLCTTSASNVVWDEYGLANIFSVSFCSRGKKTHTFNGPLSGLPGWAGTRKVKPVWILLKQETMSGSGISWAICKPAPHSRQITMPAPHHSVFYRPDALPVTQKNSVKALKAHCSREKTLGNKW